MLETSARLLRLLSLFQGRKYWSGADLAGRLEVTSRTLRRDVDKLRTLGYPIHSTAGVEGGYQLGAGSEMPPLLLDDEEAVAVALGLRVAATGSVEGVEEASVRALLKIEQILPKRLGRRLEALQSMIVTAAPAESAVDTRTLSTIAGGCREFETLRFRYRDREGAATARMVEPHRLVNTGRRWYLVAWDMAREDWRTFRVDRMERRIVPGGQRFAPRKPPAEDLAVYVARGGGWTAAPCRTRVKVHATAQAVAERFPPQAGLVEPIDDRSCYLETGARTYEWLALHLMMLGAEFEVTEPAELMAELRALSAKLHRATINSQ